MKLTNTRLKKTLLTAGCFLIGVPIFIILFISPITKYLIERYSEKYTGRAIKMDWAYVNPFTGYVHFNNFRIYEAKSDSIFLSAEGLSASFAIHKLLSKEYDITSITLDKPKGIAIFKAKSIFNFSDVIDRFSPHTSSTPELPKAPVHFNILNITINDGVFYLLDSVKHINYFIKDFNFTGPGKRWNADTFPGNFSFSPGIGLGKVAGNFTINTKNSDYHFSVLVQKLNLSIIEQYLKDIINYGTFSANIDANIKTTGNFKNAETSDTKGRIAVTDFHFGKTRSEDYLSFDKFVLAINEVSPGRHLYNLDSVVVTHPYFKFEKYDSLDNIETMLGKKEANVYVVKADKKQFNLIIELGHYLLTVSKNFFNSAYKVNHAAINQANFQFNDYSTSEKFSIALNPLLITADSIDKSKGKIKLFLKSGITPYGNASIYFNINPRDSESFDMNYDFEGIPLSILNPYFIAFSSHPFDRGTLGLNGKWVVKNGIVQSDNHILIIDPRVTKRLRNKDDKWLPMGFIMYLVRSSGNVIDYQIPVTGNLKSPEFHLHDVVFSTLKNIFVKPPATPYRVKVSTQENIIEKSLILQWGVRQSSIQSSEEKFVEKLAKFLSENPTASIAITAQQYAIKEKEYILFFEAKKKYYLSLNPNHWLTADSLYVDKMSVKDSLFVQYLNKHLAHSLVFTIQDKCSNLISITVVNTKFNQLNKARENNFLLYFKEKGVDKQVVFNSPQSDIPYNGFSFYKIAYKGDLPDYLLKAYREMTGLDNKKPREKYMKERGKIKTI
jgi:hypothetical protein